MSKFEKSINKEATSCRLCQSNLNNGNFVVIDEIIEQVLDVLLLKLNGTEKDKSIMCHTCSTKLFAAFNFKATCMDTEDCIFPYIYSEMGAPVDLSEIYLKERGKEHLKHILEDERICRLCMQVVTCGFTSIKEVDVDMFRTYIPEMNFNSVREPVICKVCLDSLDTHMSFLGDCLNVEEEIKNISSVEAVKSYLHVITEEIELKSEDYNLYPLPLSLPMPPNDKDSMNPPVFQHCYNGEYKQKENDDDKSSILYDLDLHIVKTEELNHEQPEAEICKSNNTNYNSKYRNCIKKFQDVSRAKTYNCQHCAYHTKYLSALKSHTLNHTYPSKMELYACEECDYKTKRRTALKSHMLNHTHPSEIEFYSCDECDYKTKHRNALKSHMLNHAHPSEIELYSCDKCDYKTKYRNALKSHQLNHKPPSEIEMRKCNKCSYETKHRTALVLHMLKHKSPGEIQMYKCDKCKFQTKFKHALKPHKLKHKGDT